MNQTKNIVKVYDDCALIYEAKFMDQKKYEESLDLFISSLSLADACILDVACGPGNLSRYLLDRSPNFDILGIDLSENMLSLARKNNPTAQYKKMDGRKIDELDQKYDGIICGFGLPYLTKNEAMEFINKASLLLKEDGVLYLSAILGAYLENGTKTTSSNGQNTMNIYHHELPYLLKALEENGLKNIYHKTQELTPPKKDTKELIILSKKTS